MLRAVSLRRIFSVNGRLDRRRFWRVLWALLLISAAWTGVLILLMKLGVSQPLTAVVAVAGYGAVFLASSAATIRRLHDRGLPSWLFLGLIASNWAGAALDARRLDRIELAGATAITAFDLWLTIEILIRRGQASHNRYGSDPSVTDSRA